MLLSVGWYGNVVQYEGICCYNIDTLEASQEHAIASEQRTATLPPQLGLSAQQMDIISAGVETVDGLLVLINKQRQELMGRLELSSAATDTVTAAAAGDAVASVAPTEAVTPAAAADAVTPAASADTAAAVSGSEQGPQASACSAALQASAISSDLETLSGFQQRQQHLETQQRLAARLKLLMAKQ
jgi:hypothetical protein